MTEARAQTQRKETMIHDLQDSLTSRLHLMEKTMAAQNEKLEKSFANLLEALRLIGSGASVETIQPSMSSDPAEIVSDLNQTTNQGNHFNYAGVTRLAQFDFPRFNGDKIRDWLFKIEQFFEIDHTPDELKVGLASIHLDDLAAKWHRSLVQSEAGLNVVHDWSAYKVLLQERFNDLLDDPIAELKQLQEIDGIEEYHGRFELLKARVNLPEEYLVSAYLAGLRSDTQIHVRLFHPQSIHQCLLVGRLYEMVHPPKQSPTVWSSSEIINNKETEHHMEEATMGDVQTQQHEDEDNEDAHISVDTVAELSDDAHISVDTAAELSDDAGIFVDTIAEVSENLRKMEVNSVLNNREAVVGVVERFRQVTSVTKKFPTSQLFGKKFKDKDRLKWKKRRKYLKSWRFKFKSRDLRGYNLSRVKLLLKNSLVITGSWRWFMIVKGFEQCHSYVSVSELLKSHGAGIVESLTLSLLINVAYGKKYVSNKEVRSDFLNSLSDAQIEAKYVKTMEEYSKNHLVSTLAYELFHSPRPPELFVAERMIARKVEMEEDMNKEDQKQRGDWDHSFLLIAVANRSHTWSASYHVWHRWKARYSQNFDSRVWDPGG